MPGSKRHLQSGDSPIRLSCAAPLIHLRFDEHLRTPFEQPTSSQHIFIDRIAAKERVNFAKPENWKDYFNQEIEMACENCGSDNTRLAEQGVMKDTYYCLNCGHSYTRLSSTAKGGMAATLGTAIGGPVLGGLLWTIFGGGGDSDGGTS